jgi:hypothetical protein
MTSTTLRNRILATTSASVLAWCTAPTASAVPISGLYIEDARCDTLPNMNLSHELGDASTFPANEAILVFVSPTNTTICVPNDGIANDWNVQITNVSGQAWQDLYFVANANNGVGNADGSVLDLSNAAIPPSDAFRIDGTVTPGATNSLVESGIADEIFSPGETWRFMVSNFQHPSGVSPVPAFLSPGLFAGTASVTTLDQASILANPVPEPATVAMLTVIGAGMVLRRRRRA